jgi:uncharacterized protein YsxB (DUF464 family)
MGYMTVVSILNDAWPTIKENHEQFIANIEHGMDDYDPSKTIHHYPISGYANPMEVRRSFHANQSVLLMVGQNHMEEVANINPHRKQEDFYLAYKMRTAMQAKEMADAAATEIANAFARMVANAMKTEGLPVDKIKEKAQTYDTFNAMDVETQNIVIFKIGALLCN